MKTLPFLNRFISFPFTRFQVPSLHKSAAVIHDLVNRADYKQTKGCRFFSSRDDANLTREKGSLSAHVLSKMNVSRNETPLKKGYNYLEQSCSVKRCFQPLVSSFPDFRGYHPSPYSEIFDTALILDLVEASKMDPRIVERGLNYLETNQRTNGLFNFFEDSSLLPEDVDSTSLTMLVLLKHKRRSLKEAHHVADQIIANVDSHGIIQTYFPPRGGRDDRIDPSVCANAIRFLYHIGRKEECQATVDYLFSFLKTMKISENPHSLYYGNQTLFYFMWEAIQSSPQLKDRFSALFSEKITERTNARCGKETLSKDFHSLCSPIELACWLMACSDLQDTSKARIGIVEQLCRLQHEDGSWPIDVAYTGSRKNLYWGSNALSTAFVLRALDHPSVKEQVLSIAKSQKERAVLSRGFQLEGGRLQYTRSFVPVHLKFKLIVITHAETKAGRDVKFYDAEPHSPNNQLTEKGEQDAVVLAEKVQKVVSGKRVAVFHANNTRTLQTALKLTTRLKEVTPQCLPWLNEMSCPEWLGKDSYDIFKKVSSARAMFMDSHCLAKAPSGENFLEYLNKVHTGLAELSQSSFEKDTVVVLCTSRVTLVALKILFGKEVDFNATGIDWSEMAKKVKPGSIFIKNETE